MEACTEGWAHGTVGGRHFHTLHPTEMHWRYSWAQRSPWNWSSPLLGQDFSTSVHFISKRYLLPFGSHQSLTSAAQNIQQEKSRDRLLKNKQILWESVWTTFAGKSIELSQFVWTSDVCVCVGGGWSLTRWAWGRKGAESHRSCPLSFRFLLEESKSSDLHWCGSLVTRRSTDNSSLPPFSSITTAEVNEEEKETLWFLS